jgi:predicted  nucleic acid-binding Zn-ribbon protein
MNHPTSSPEKESNTKVEEVIDRLINEVRNYRIKLQDIRKAISSFGIDFEKLTVIGAIRKLASDNKELKDEVKALKKELDNISRRK